MSFSLLRRLGRPSQQVLVYSVARVDTFNEFLFVPSTGSTVSMSFGLGRQEAELFLFGQILFHVQDLILRQV